MKKCSKCKENFIGNGYYCKDCHKIYIREWRINNHAKDKQMNLKSWRNRKKEKPWYQTLANIKQRCTNPNNDRYSRYGGRGIKCLITEEELKILWFRDNAYLMKRPSIDRENNDGNYEFGNCQYIEAKYNSIKQWKEKRR